MKLSWSRRVNITEMTIWRLAFWPQIGKDWSTLLDRAYIKHSFKIMPNVHLCQLHLMTEGWVMLRIEIHIYAARDLVRNKEIVLVLTAVYNLFAKTKENISHPDILNCWLQLQ